MARALFILLTLTRVATATSGIRCTTLLDGPMQVLAMAGEHLRSGGKEPDEAWHELWSYKALVDFDANERDYVVASAHLKGIDVVPPMRVGVGSDMGAVISDIMKIADSHRISPGILVVELDKAFGYEFPPAERRLANFLAELHVGSALRIVVYSPWENAITRDLVAEHGIPLRP